MDETSAAGPGAPTAHTVPSAASPPPLPPEVAAALSPAAASPPAAVAPRRDGASSAALASIRRYCAFGLFVILALVGGLGGWAAVAEISGGVIAPGAVAVEGNIKRVQHLEGGIVARIAVRNADVVAAGDVLVQLDDTDVRAQLQITQGQLEELRARQARLVAERDGATVYRPDLTAVAPTAAEVWQGQARLFTARYETRLGREKQHLERIGQLEEVVRGLDAQRVSKDKQLRLIREELDGLSELEEKQLVTRTRVLALQREETRLEGERGQLLAEMAKTNVQASETRLAIAEAKQAFLSEVLAEVREVETKVAELAEREVAIRSRMKRLAIIAPQSGIVHKLAVHTVGGVVAPGEAVMEIVPQGERLVIDGQVDPIFVEQVKVGQSALVRLTAFDLQITPELAGTVQSVSADVRQDTPQSPRYYAVRVAIDDGELGKLRGGKLVPGMPAEVIIRRIDRTVLSYLAKPIVDQLAHVFRER
jgi:HlyD family secretion protein